MQASGLSHIGRRPNNEDSYRIEPELGLFLVADGMGGYEGGEIASRLVVDTLTDFFARNRPDAEVSADESHDHDGDHTPPEQRMALAIRMAHREVQQEAKGRLREMGSTLAALQSHGDKVLIAHVGDSRVYRLRKRRIERLTRDHSVVSDIELTLGRPIHQRSSHPMGTVVTRALGGGGDARADVLFLDVAAQDRFLLCSDGLTDSIIESELRPLLARGTPDEASDLLLEQAVKNGARDNVTVIVVDVLRL